jgi:hypothetical protein
MCCIGAQPPCAASPPPPPPRHVRRAAVQVLSTAAHTKPGLVVEHLPGALPLLHAQTAVDAALIRTVDLGPFKHQIDDGLDLRKVPAAWWRCCRGPGACWQLGAALHQGWRSDPKASEACVLCSASSLQRARGPLHPASQPPDHVPPAHQRPPLPMQAAFECLDELLERCYDRLDVAALLAALEAGLRDHYDVKTLAHPTLARLAAIAPGQVRPCQRPVPQHHRTPARTARTAAGGLLCPGSAGSPACCRPAEPASPFAFPSLAVCVVIPAPCPSPPPLCPPGACRRSPLRWTGWWSRWAPR